MAHKGLHVCQQLRRHALVGVGGFKRFSNLLCNSAERRFAATAAGATGCMLCALRQVLRPASEVLDHRRQHRLHGQRHNLLRAGVYAALQDIVATLPLSTSAICSIGASHHNLVLSMLYDCC